MVVTTTSEPGTVPAAGLRGALSAALLAQRGRLILWVPICLAFGIGGWFSLRIEPGLAEYAACGLGAGALFLLGRQAGEGAAPLFWGIALVLCGALLAGARAHSVAAPVLGFRYYGAIEGRIIDIDRSVSDKPRLTLDRVVLEDVAPSRTPARVRVSLHGQQGFIAPEPGLTVILTGHLSPPSGPVEPGGFDFRRMAWFERLGGVGYTRTPVLAAAPAEEGRAGLAIFRLRMAISEGVQARIPGEAGALAAAILTGDRSAMPRETVENLRNANLAHLLAISGLHMGLLTGAVFAALRAAMALIPWVALRLPTRKIAAAGALVVGAFYLALSGGAVSTTRAFVMVSVMLVAVLLERRAISLRSVALAATVLLVLTPETLFGPSFQMSFAATTALVAAFGALKPHRERMARLPRWLAPAVAVLISSAVAGAATAPFSAAHFNRIADYGLLANLASVPLMGALVMPSAVAAAVLWPIGLSWVGLWLMRWGLEWILFVAARVSALDGAVTHVIAPGPWVLPLLSLGFLVTLLWRGPLRWSGLLAMVAALGLWTQADRPDVLISDTGGVVGVMGPEGRSLSRPKGDGFAALSWLENDGDGADQAEAAARPGFTGDRFERRAQAGALTVRHLTGKTGLARLGTACGADVLVTNQPLTNRPEGACRLFDPESLRKSGAVSIRIGDEGPVFETVAERTGHRMWAP
ncbi:ComEC/Rec2 family competence protein [Tropicimonas isoalkanivorans]|uniref:Competence protein ComEC n=1 Tax=Tropicimonas isoalkanivorans TaxID=441112 RepID=A0A1I1DZI2_9RHOB|nr:ComEC/Rec2 family competence protein [Tropicimonas isoalkanivorans]SFB80217.1 competence protein ComEC [Tropicimonas isoalkanivorans]